MCYYICLIARKRRSFHMCVENAQKGRGERPSVPNGLLLAGALEGGYRVAIKGRCRGIKPSIWAYIVNISIYKGPAVDPSGLSLSPDNTKIKRKGKRTAFFPR